MSVKEKILLVQLILEDIRGNWGHGCYGKDAEDRALKARDLCQEIASELNDNTYMTLAETCEEYIKGSQEWGDWDGRYFRAAFPSGYENMSELHGLAETYEDKSDDFKFIADDYLTYPENRFDDWREEFRVI